MAVQFYGGFMSMTCVSNTITFKQRQLHAKWLRDGSGQRLEAVDADLRGAALRFANLQCVNLRDADLRDADLREANLSESTLYGADLRCANLRGADMRGASLRGADIRGVDLREVIGNMCQIKSAQFDEWPIVWSADVLAIGCQQHAIEKWRNADPRWIAAMDDDAADWWARCGALVLHLINTSPATGVVIGEAS
jgi:uncharacterized protein YjbI with pentapeptide repeats